MCWCLWWTTKLHWHSLHWIWNRSSCVYTCDIFMLYVYVHMYPISASYTIITSILCQNYLVWINVYTLIPEWETSLEILLFIIHRQFRFIHGNWGWEFEFSCSPFPEHIDTTFSSPLSLTVIKSNGNLMNNSTILFKIL